jgi:hypothetical protein
MEHGITFEITSTKLALQNCPTLHEQREDDGICWLNVLNWIVDFGNRTGTRNEA